MLRNFVTPDYVYAGAEPADLYSTSTVELEVDDKPLRWIYGTGFDDPSWNKACAETLSQPYTYGKLSLPYGRDGTTCKYAALAFLAGERGILQIASGAPLLPREDYLALDASDLLVDIIAELQMHPDEEAFPLEEVGLISSASSAISRKEASSIAEELARITSDGNDTPMVVLTGGLEEVWKKGRGFYPPLRTRVEEAAAQTGVNPEATRDNKLAAVLALWKRFPNAAVVAGPPIVRPYENAEPENCAVLWIPPEERE